MQIAENLIRREKLIRKKRLAGALSEDETRQLKALDAGISYALRDLKRLRVDPNQAVSDAFRVIKMEQDSRLNSSKYWTLSYPKIDDIGPRLKLWKL